MNEDLARLEELALIAIEALAGKFPFMRRHQRPDWTAGTMLTAAEQLVRLPDPDQQAAAALLDQDAIPPKKAIEILENLTKMPPQRRREIFKLARVPSSVSRNSAWANDATFPGDLLTTFRKTWLLR